MTGAAVIAAGILAACATRHEAPSPLHLTASADGPDTRLAILAAPGIEINARLPPALELADGTVLRFESGRRTADLAYFAEPPIARLPGRHDRVHGTLRASVCREDEQVCRTVTLRL
jgi:hypothetical protein